MALDAYGPRQVLTAAQNLGIQNLSYNQGTGQYQVFQEGRYQPLTPGQSQELQSLLAPLPEAAFNYSRADPRFEGPRDVRTGEWTGGGMGGIAGLALAGLAAFAVMRGRKRRR